MGGCNSTPEERGAEAWSSVEQKRINNLIEEQLHEDKREQSVKILLLGTGHFMVLVWGLMVLMQSNSDPVLCCTVHELEAKESTSRRKWKVYNLEADENLAPKRQRQRQRIAHFQVPIVRSNVISALEVSQQSV